MSTHAQRPGAHRRAQRHSLRSLLLAAATLALLASCASVGVTPSSQPMPAARAGLPPDYRIFYDALEGMGDWVLVEPLGWVFRPDVNFVAWKPYERGFWTWNDWYGWVWISEEPFGWATYHYGRWFYDDFQGWLWMPGLTWGPAWVAWARNGDYVGWAALPPRGGPTSEGYPQGTPPLGGWNFVPMGEMAGSDLVSRLADREQSRELLAQAKPVVRMVERDGAQLNMGPPVEAVEKVAGVAMPRTEIVDPLKSESFARPKGKSGGVAPSDAAAGVIRKAGQDAAQKAGQVPKGPPPRQAVVPRVPPGLHRESGGRSGTHAMAPPYAADTLVVDSTRTDR
jgi:hypothetical protein